MKLRVRSYTELLTPDALRTLAVDVRKRARTNIAFGQEINECSWGMETGVLLTNQEALLFAELLTKKARLRRRHPT